MSKILEVTLDKKYTDESDLKEKVITTLSEGGHECISVSNIIIVDGVKYNLSVEEVQGSAGSEQKAVLKERN